jgi:outer membrane protein assembly factor BamB
MFRTNKENSIKIKNKKLDKEASFAAALILLLSFSALLCGLPIVAASNPPLQIPTYAYLAISPDPTGVGQTVFLVMWLHMAPPTAAGNGGDRWKAFTVDITKPNGQTERLGPVNSDPTGSTFLAYTPDQIGTYTFVFKYPGQVLSLNNPTNGLPGATSPYINDTFLPSQTTTTLKVQTKPVNPVEEYPLPTRFWTRPVAGDNVAWTSIESNWLRGGQSGGYNLWQAGTGPNSAHILWTKPIEFGGVVGGNWAQGMGETDSAVSDVGFYSGGSYEGRFTNAIIMGGLLYYSDPLGHSNGGGGYTCVDLKTGQVKWHSDTLNIFNNTVPSVNGIAVSLIPAPSFGQLYDYESPNQHGVTGGILWQSSSASGVTTWQGFDAYSGKWIFNETYVPTGTDIYTDDGELVRYVLSYNTTSNTGTVALWNNTQEQMGLHNGLGTTTNAWQWRPVGKSVNMSLAYTWNVTLPNLSGNSAPAIVQILPGDIILGRSSAISAGVGDKFTPDPYTIWAISDKAANRGQLLWKVSYPAPSGNLTRRFLTVPIDPVNRVFIMSDVETMQFLGYSLDTGRLLWGPTNIPMRAFQYYGGGEGGGQRGVLAYGNVYIQGYGGEVFCLNAKTGDLIWRFNDTDSGVDTPWGLRPIFIATIADGKVYAFNNEHSPNSPLYKGNCIYCIDAYTGKEIYKMLGWSGQTGGPGTSTAILADGVLTYYNYYDNQIYAVGKGPSATTVDAPMSGVTLGQKLVLRGTITDQSAGAKAAVANGEFALVPAMSDADQAHWMQYIYMDKPMPTNAAGVTVHLTAIDPNGNFQDLGNATSDTLGNFAISYSPPVTGLYKVTATFEGSASYYGSEAGTAFVVSEAAKQVVNPAVVPTSAAPTTPPQTAAPTATAIVTVAPTPSPVVVPPANAAPTVTYIAIGLAIIIIIIAAAAAITLRRRK